MQLFKHSAYSSKTTQAEARWRKAAQVSSLWVVRCISLRKYERALHDHTVPVVLSLDPTLRGYDQHNSGLLCTVDFRGLKKARQRKSLITILSVKLIFLRLGVILFRDTVKQSGVRVVDSPVVLIYKQCVDVRSSFPIKRSNCWNTA